MATDLKIKLKIVTPEKTVFEDEINQATLPTTEGEVTILPNHRSYIASLKPGGITVKNGKEETLLCISGGFIEFHSNELVVLADTAERAEEIDLKMAEEARRKAQELQKQRITMDEDEFAAVMSAIQRETARIRVARKHYSRRGITLGD